LQEQGIFEKAAAKIKKEQLDKETAIEYLKMREEEDEK